jgi:hypothetical protein
MIALLDDRTVRIVVARRYSTINARRTCARVAATMDPMIHDEKSRRLNKKIEN